jgi:hypothetical protein
MAADELLVLGEGHVAFENAGSHLCTGNVGLARVLGELHCRAAMADGERARSERPADALPKLGLQRFVL